MLPQICSASNVHAGFKTDPEIWHTCSKSPHFFLIFFASFFFSFFWRIWVLGDTKFPEKNKEDKLHSSAAGKGVIYHITFISSKSRGTFGPQWGNLRSYAVITQFQYGINFGANITSCWPHVFRSSNICLKLFTDMPWTTAIGAFRKKCKEHVCFLRKRLAIIIFLKACGQCTHFRHQHQSYSVGPQLKSGSSHPLPHCPWRSV